MIRHKDLEIDKDNPFANCKLNREQYANVLTQIVSTYKEGFVLAINNKWGTGKTTFVNMWEKQLVKDGYKTVYFNAWENDFEDNALTALMGELSSLVDTSTQKDFNEVLQKGAVIAKNILPGIIKAIVGKYIDVEELKNFSEAATKGMTEIFEEDVKEYSKKKDSIKEFKQKLQKFISDTTEDKPLIFIVDELDRCRPNYAVSVLEQIKHFFSVPGIVFVLSIDKEQLGHAIKGVYGNDNIDADEYLRRFIDIEYNLPELNIAQYCNYLYNYFDFKSHFEKRTHSEFAQDKDTFLSISSILFDSKKTTLRQQQKIFAHTRLVLKSFSEKQYTYPPVLIYLIYIKNLNPIFYKKIVNKELDLESIINELKKTINSKTINDEDLNYVCYLEAHIIYQANKYIAMPNRAKSLISKDDSGNFIPTIRSKFDDNSDTLVRFFTKLENRHPQVSDLGYLISRIELVESFNMS